MNTVLCSTSAAATVKGVQARSSRSSTRAVVPVTCNLQAAKKAAAAAAVTIPSLAAMPALALVDERLAGEGTSAIFGITAGPEAWAIFLTFGLIWAVYATTAKTLGNANNEDSGMSL